MLLNQSKSVHSMKMIEGIDGSSPSGGGQTKLLSILAVDDDPSALRMIEKALGERARVFQKYGAPQRGELELEGIDLVVLDYKMPTRDGLDVLSEIKETFPNLPVIFLTGFGDGEILKRSLELGADRFVAKPASPLLLQQIVDDMFAPENRERPKLGKKSSDAEKERNIRARSFFATDVGGRELSARVSRFSSQSAIVEFEKSAELKPGDRLTNIIVKFGRQHVSAIEGIVTGSTSLGGGSSEHEITLHRTWDVAEEANSTHQSNVTFSSATTSEQVAYDGAGLPSDFRLAVYDFASLIRRIHQEAAAFELTAGVDKDQVERFEEEGEFVVETAEKHKKGFWEVMNRFEAAAIELESDGLTEAAKPFARKCLYPFMLCSPFISRVVERPIGVPGDFEMLGQILGNPLEGHSLYDRIVSSYILKSGAANAYRYRIDLLDREIRRTVKERHALGEGAKILSMASGVAYEVQNYIQHPSDDGSVDFTLVDFSDDTLEEARRQYDRLGTLPENVTLKMEQSSVIDLANQSRGLVDDSGDQFVPDSDYDHVYCAGLFDYLSDRLIVKVIAYLHGILKPGGTVVVSNFTTDNPIKGYMTIVMDWELIYRSAEEFEALVKRAVPNAEYEMELDHGGSEVYAIIKN